MFRDGDGPGLGLRYDFRRTLPSVDYAERPEEFEAGERLGFTGAWLSEHRFVDDGFPPSPLVVAATADRRNGEAGEESPHVTSEVAFVREDAGRPKPA